MLLLFELVDLAGVDPGNGAHVHGHLRVRMDEVLIEYPEPICVNDWLAALAGILGKIVSEDRSGDPTSFSVEGPEGWPVLDALRMEEMVRVAFVEGGESPSSGFMIPVVEFQAAVERFLGEAAEQVRRAAGLAAKVSVAELAQTRCRQFWCGEAGTGFPRWE